MTKIQRALRSRSRTELLSAQMLKEIERVSPERGFPTKGPFRERKTRRYPFQFTTAAEQKHFINLDYSEPFGRDGMSPSNFADTSRAHNSAIEFPFRTIWRATVELSVT